MNEFSNSSLPPMSKEFSLSSPGLFQYQEDDGGLLSSESEIFLRKCGERRSSFRKSIKINNLFHWSKINDSRSKLKPSDMSGHVCIVYGRSMYVFGGYNEGKALNDIWALDLDTQKWRIIEAAAEKPPPRTSHSVVVDHSEGIMYVLCGSGSSFGNSNLNDVWMFHLRYHFWKQLQFEGSEKLSARYGQSSVLYENKIYVFGGTSGRDFNNELFVIDLELKKIYKVRQFGEMPSPRYKHAAEKIGKHHMLLFGGAELLNYDLNDCYLLDLKTLKWKCIDCDGDIPKGRFAHTMVVQDMQVFVYGGTNRSNCFSDVYQLDVKQRSWAKIGCSGKHFPSARYFHGSVLDTLSGNMITFAGKTSVHDQSRSSDLFSIQVMNGKDEEYFDPVLSQDFLELLESDPNDLADCNLKGTDSVEFRCHRVVLAARNEKLKQWVKEPPKEKTELLEIRIPYEAKVIQLFLQYVYSDQLVVDPSTEFRTYLDLLDCSLFLDDIRLSYLCQARIEQMMNKENALFTLNRLRDSSMYLPRIEMFLLSFLSIHSAGTRLSEKQVTFVLKEQPCHVPLMHSRLSKDFLCLRLLYTSAYLSHELMNGDVTFNFEKGRQLYGHSVILSARCGYFRNFTVQNMMQESKSSSFDFSSTPSTPFLSQRSFTLFLDYIYGGSSTFSNLDDRTSAELISKDVCNYFDTTSQELSRFCISKILYKPKDNREPIFPEDTTERNCLIM